MAFLIYVCIDTGLGRSRLTCLRVDDGDRRGCAAELARNMVGLRICPPLYPADNEGQPGKKFRLTLGF